jgi:predicted transcriptional regulator
MSSFSLRLPDELKEQAAAQAEAAGVSLNQYIATALAARVGAQAEAERYFAARAARATPGRAREILARAGQDNPPQPGDELDVAAASP